jgi:hypothetical protein
MQHRVGVIEGRHFHADGCTMKKWSCIDMVVIHSARLLHDHFLMVYGTLVRCKWPPAPLYFTPCPCQILLCVEIESMLGALMHVRGSKMLESYPKEQIYGSKGGFIH